MTQSTYIKVQLDYIEEAIKSGQAALDTAKSLQKIYRKKNDDKEAYSEDALQFYNVDSALQEIEWMKIRMKEFKHRLIEIKMENDKRLMEGGFIRNLDKEIAELFLNHTLCKMSALDPKTVETFEDALNVLGKLKIELIAML